tara:strand:+ start:178 stop:882 length:705 start_codon:yes stop_codon:yes gene_type:complete
MPKFSQWFANPYTGKYVRTDKEVDHTKHLDEHIKRWNWIGTEGKSFDEIDAPNSGYRNSFKVNKHLAYDIEKVGMIEWQSPEKITYEDLESTNTLTEKERCAGTPGLETPDVHNIFNIKVSVGDFMDRYSILTIKKDNGLDVATELKQYDDAIDPMYRSAMAENLGWNYYFNMIKTVNEQLWSLEDIKRKGVTRGTSLYSDVAELITLLNDVRFNIKNSIDTYFKSNISEKKSH